MTQGFPYRFWWLFWPAVRYGTVSNRGKPAKESEAEPGEEKEREIKREGGRKKEREGKEPAGRSDGLRGCQRVQFIRAAPQA